MTIPNHEQPLGGGADEFVALLTRHQPGLHNYLTALVGNPADVDDLMQEVSVALWHRYPKYDPQRPFFKWACGVAYIEVLRYRQRRARDRHWFSESVLESLSAQFIEKATMGEHRREALSECLASLRAADYQLIHQRYTHGVSVTSLAGEYGHTANAIYKRLAKIRDQLYRCVSTRMMQAEHPNEL
ncbi:MAG: sigma-70 family RNA polymerase sigma factor [Planctomycetota bacterium]